MSTRGLLALLGAVFAFGVVGVASGEVNAVTPSTNEANVTNGWAHVTQLSKGLRTTNLEFVSTRGFYSCFEYRTDGDTSQKIGATNFNPAVTDGLYPYVCENNSSETLTISAKAYVEVRMVFGAETDERFDWTRFDVDSCQATGLFRDGTNLTAAQIGGDLTGTLDATGCNIGVYYGPGTSGSVADAEIFGANYYGVVANAADVDVTGSSIHDVGETPLNGAQHGVGVLYTTIDQAGTTTGPAATGTLSGSTIERYQKNGVVVSGGGAAVSLIDNTVTGEGQVAYIAQNGIQVSYGASALVRGNTVSGNWYTPKSYVACGLLFYQASGVKQQANTLFANEVNLCNVGRGGGNVSLDDE